MGRPWNIERLFKMPYTKLGDRSVETCEAYRRGRSLRDSPSFTLGEILSYEMKTLKRTTVPMAAVLFLIP